MAIASFVSSLTEGVFGGMDWREERNTRKRRQEIVDQEMEWRKEDRDIAADERAYTKEERARRRKEEDRAIQMREAELAAWGETVDGMLGRGTPAPTASTSGAAAAPATERDPYAVPPPAALSFGNLDAPQAMTESPVQAGTGPGEVPLTVPGTVPNPEQRSALTVPEVTPDPTQPQRPQDPEAAPDALPAERRNGAPPSSQADMSLMDMAVQSARQNERSGKASDGPRDRAPVTARPEQGPPAPQEMSVMDAALRAAQLNAINEAKAGQSNGRPLQVPQGKRPDWLPEDYLLPPEVGPQVNQQAPAQPAPTSPQGARPEWLPETVIPGGFQVTPASAPAMAPPVANRDMPMAPQGNPPAAPPQTAPPPPAAPAAPRGGQPPASPARAPQVAAPAAPPVPTTEEGTPVASVAVAAATAPPPPSLSFGIIGKDGPVKATKGQYDRAATAATKAYVETEMPAIVEHYLRTGQVEKAAAFEKFVKDKKTQEGIGEFMKAAHALNIGDEKTALTAIAGAYNGYIDDGFEALPDESDLTYDENGALTGGVMVFRNTETGEVFKQQFNGGRDLMVSVLGAISPENAFEDLSNALLGKTDNNLTDSEKTIFNAAMKAMQAEAEDAALSGVAPMSVEEMTARAMALAKGGGQGGAAPAPASNGITEDDI